MFRLHTFTDEDGHPLDEDESGMRLCTCWGKIFESRAEDERHHAHDTIREYVQKAPDDIHCEIDKREFDEMIAAKKESSPGPDGIPQSIYICAGWVGWDLTSCLTLKNVCLRVALSPHTLLRTVRSAHTDVPLRLLPVFATKFVCSCVSKVLNNKRQHMDWRQVWAHLQLEGRQSDLVVTTWPRDKGCGVVQSLPVASGRS